MVVIDSRATIVNGVAWRHITATDVDELHTFIKKIGGKREWFQDKPQRPHYDLQHRLSMKAIACGAVSLDRKGMHAFFEQHHFGPHVPETRTAVFCDSCEGVGCWLDNPAQAVSCPSCKKILYGPKFNRK